MALVACVLWLVGFELLPWLHIATHDHIGAHHHDATGAIIRDDVAHDDHDDDHDAATDEHAPAHDHDHDDQDAEVDEHGNPVAHHHADPHHDAQHHDSQADSEKRVRDAIGHGRHSLAHHDVSTTAPPPVMTKPLPVERRVTFVLAETAIEPFSFSPGRAVARGPPTIS